MSVLKQLSENTLGKFLVCVQSRCFLYCEVTNEP